MTRFLASLLLDRRGVAAAEMALVTPLLVIIMFGAFEAGNYFWNEHIVIKAVRDGARFAGRQSFSKFTCAAVNDTAVETAIKDVTRTGATPAGTSRVGGWTNAQITVSVSCSTATNKGIYTQRPSGAPIVTVSTTVPYLSLFGALIFANNLNLTAAAQSPVMGI